MFIKKTLFPAVNGFTMVELLLVMTLAPIIFVAVFSNFSTGTRIWQRLQAETPEEDAAIFLSKARRDFSDAMRFSVFPFLGDPEEVVFAAAIQAPGVLGGERGIGQVHYYYDPALRGIMREMRDYSRVHEEKPGVVQRMLTGVSVFEITYLAYDPRSSEYVWGPEFAPKQGASPLPAAVRLSYSTDSGAVVQHTLFVNSGGGTR